MDYTMLDFDGLKAELDGHVAEVAAIRDEMKRRAQKEIARLKGRMTELAAFVEEKDASPVAAKSERKERQTGQPKYRHPHDKMMTWSGNGKRPNWFKDWIDAGNDPTQLLIAA